MIEKRFIVECERCETTDYAPKETENEAEAREYFTDMGWSMEVDILCDCCAQQEVER